MIWPLVVLGVMRFTRSLRALLALCCAAAIGSALWMYHVYDGGLNTNRAYLGTDTRSQCLFIGCALAVGLVLVSQRHHEQGRLAKGELWRPESSAGRLLCGVLGVLGAGGAIALWVADHLDVDLPLLGRLLPHWAVGGHGHPGRGGGAPQRCPADAVVVADPLRGADLLRALHLALAHLHLARPRPDGPVRLRALRVPRPRHLRRLGRVLPPRRAPDPHGHLHQPVAGVAGRPRRCRGRAGGRDRGDDGNIGRGQHSLAGRHRRTRDRRRRPRPARRRLPADGRGLPGEGPPLR